MGDIDPTEVGLAQMITSATGMSPIAITEERLSVFGGMILKKVAYSANGLGWFIAFYVGDPVAIWVVITAGHRGYMLELDGDGRYGELCDLWRAFYDPGASIGLRSCLFPFGNAYVRIRSGSSKWDLELSR